MTVALLSVFVIAYLIIKYAMFFVKFEMYSDDYNRFHLCFPQISSENISAKRLKLNVSIKVG